jgi:3-oxoacyl-[acyl-carrier protein] reductase
VGYVSAATVDDVTEAELRCIIDHNFTGLVHFFQVLRRALRSPWTGVVVVSNAAFVARPQQPIYAAMKAAVASLVKSLAVCWAGAGIRLMAVAPGTVIVDRNRDSVLRRNPDAPQDLSRPGGRMLIPSELARFIAGLLDHRDHLTGQVVILDGGSSLGAR